MVRQRELSTVTLTEFPEVRPVPRYLRKVFCFIWKQWLLSPGDCMLSSGSVMTPKHLNMTFQSWNCSQAHEDARQILAEHHGNHEYSLVALTVMMINTIMAMNVWTLLWTTQFENSLFCLCENQFCLCQKPWQLTNIDSPWSILSFLGENSVWKYNLRISVKVRSKRRFLSAYRGQLIITRR